MNYAAEKRFAVTTEGGGEEKREEGEVNETKMRARDMRLMAGRNAMRPSEAEVLHPTEYIFERMSSDSEDLAS